MLEQAVSFDAYRLIQTARVHEFDGQRRICFPEKEAWNVYELFHTRHSLHKRAYQHRVACVCARMIMKAMTLADTAGYVPVRACACLPWCMLVYASPGACPSGTCRRSHAATRCAPSQLLGTDGQTRVRMSDAVLDMTACVEWGLLLSLLPLPASPVFLHLSIRVVRAGTRA